jgi:hypothetical protein
MHVDKRLLSEHVLGYILAKFFPISLDFLAIRLRYLDDRLTVYAVIPATCIEYRINIKHNPHTSSPKRQHVHWKRYLAKHGADLTMTYKLTTIAVQYSAGQSFLHFLTLRVISPLSFVKAHNILRYCHSISLKRPRNLLLQ